MKLVCIGVGGSGASCLEVLVHLAALGLFPNDCEVVPVAIDPDRGHPRISGMTAFMDGYERLRAAGDATDLKQSGLFGARIHRHYSLNTGRPSEKESLFQLLGLADPGNVTAARMFFGQAEIGGPDSHEFSNGFYGHANAGVCFFADPDEWNTILSKLRQHLLAEDVKVVVFGSNFGGTGAAGIVHVARGIAQDERLQARGTAVPVALVQLEPYFKPDASRAIDETFVNQPETFRRRSGAAYSFLRTLAENDNLPFQVLYALGTENPAVFPPEWFKRDQQDNPHLWVEYLAVLAALDYVRNAPTDGASCQIRIRRVAQEPFGSLLGELRTLLAAATCCRQVITDFIIPVLRDNVDSAAVPGHPWLHDVLSAAEVPSSNLLEQCKLTADLLSVITGHAGILPATWRVGSAVWADPRSTDMEQAARASDDERRRLALMTQVTRDSFPTNFTMWQENVKPSSMLPNAVPDAMFDSYASKQKDGRLPLRALFRWAQDELALPPGPQTNMQSRKYQLVIQEPDQGDSVTEAVNLANISEDSFHILSADDFLNKVARHKVWTGSRESGVASLGRTSAQARELPSIWASALVFESRIRQKTMSEEQRLLHMGLLWLTFVKCFEHERPPITLLPLGHKGLSGVMQSTFPYRRFEDVFGQSQYLPVLYMQEEPLLAGQMPSPDCTVGLFFPGSIVVPAAAMPEGQQKQLIAFGRYAVGAGLPNSLEKAANAFGRDLARHRVPEADLVAVHLREYLQSFVPSLQGGYSVPTRYRSVGDMLDPNGNVIQMPSWLSALVERHGNGGQS